jgi:RNA polymerase sigma-70 factor (ECF subfamily)
MIALPANRKFLPAAYLFSFATRPDPADRNRRTMTVAEDEAFAAQEQIRPSWRKFIDAIAPLRPELLRYCSGLTGNVWDGEDLLQDVLIRVFALLGKINADLTHPRPYIIRAATNLWIDRLRRDRLARTHADAQAQDVEDDKALASQVVDVRAAANVLFLNLAPMERAAVLLSDVLDLSLKETASMLKTTEGAIKSALHRGRSRLTAARTVPDAVARTPREVVDRFVAALNGRDIEAIRALCLADVTVDMVGGAAFEGYEQGKITLEHAHYVNPRFGFGENPHWRTIEYLGEPIAIGFRTLGGVEGLNEIWRFEMGDGGVARLRLYCFSPDVLAEVAKDVGLVALRRPYRSPG